MTPEQQSAAGWLCVMAAGLVLLWGGFRKVGLATYLLAATVLLCKVSEQTPAMAMFGILIGLYGFSKKTLLSGELV
jgi:hypothetical protein